MDPETPRLNASASSFLEKMAMAFPSIFRRLRKYSIDISKSASIGGTLMFKYSEMSFQIPSVMMAVNLLHP